MSFATRPDNCQILSTLLRSGFSTEALGEENVDIIVTYLQDHLQWQHGLLGFGASVFRAVCAVLTGPP